jgi:hypothetical protein
MTYFGLISLSALALALILSVVYVSHDPVVCIVDGAGDPQVNGFYAAMGG